MLVNQLEVHCVRKRLASLRYSGSVYRPWVSLRSLGELYYATDPSHQMKMTLAAFCTGDRIGHSAWLALIAMSVGVCCVDHPHTAFAGMEEEG